jgi:hypothetical protein
MFTSIGFIETLLHPVHAAEPAAVVVECIPCRMVFCHGLTVGLLVRCNALGVSIVVQRSRLVGFLLMRLLVLQGIQSLLPRDSVHLHHMVDHERREVPASCRHVIQQAK